MPLPLFGSGPTGPFFPQQGARRAAGIVLMVLGAAACASSGGAPGGAPQSATPRAMTDAPAARRAILTDGTGVTYSSAPPEQSRRMAMAPATVLAAARQAYAGFMIPVTLDDRVNRRVGNPDFYRVRQFLGRPMVELVDCGSGMTGPNAASFRIYMALVTRVKDAPGGASDVSVQLSATAKDLTSGTSTDLLPCGSSGKIEQRLLDEIEKRARGG